MNQKIKLKCDISLLFPHVGVRKAELGLVTVAGRSQKNVKKLETILDFF